MRGSDDGERVSIFVQLCDAIGAIQELDDRKFKTEATAEDFITEVVELPVLFIVGEHGQAGDGGGMAVIEPIVVSEHAPSKAAVALTLHFDVDVDRRSSPLLRVTLTKASA